MIFLLRVDAALPDGARVVHTRQSGDRFCVAENVEVALHDGWYPDEKGGGVAVWGNGRYWEVRSTPFDVVAHD